MKVICLAIEFRSSNRKKNGVKHVTKYLVVAEIILSRQYVLFDRVRCLTDI